MTASSSLIASAVSLLSIADLTRLINRSVVSLPEASQSAQMRPSTSLALSASGAALSASNRNSRFLTRSPRGSRGSFSGASAQLPGSARSGVAKAPAASREAAKARASRMRMRQVYDVHAAAQYRQACKCGQRRVRDRDEPDRPGSASALAGLEALLRLVDDVEAAL